jgi:hypothetical protein
MAKTPLAVFAQTPKTSTAVVTAAATNLGTDAPTGTVLLLTAGTEGAILTRLTVMPRASTTASSLLLFLSNDGGTTMRLIDSELLKITTISTSTAIEEATFGNYTESRPLRLAANDRLYVGSQVALAAGLVFKAEWADF